MFGSKKKKQVHFNPTFSPIAAPTYEWVATLQDPPPPQPTYPYAHPHSYSLPFSSPPPPLPSSDPKPAKLPAGPLYFFAPLGPSSGGGQNGYLGRPTQPPSGSTYGGGLGEAPKEKEKPAAPPTKAKEGAQPPAKAAADEAAQRKAWEQAYWAAMGYAPPPAQGQGQQAKQQVVAQAAKPVGEPAKAAGGGGGFEMPRIGRPVPSGTVEGALVATWPGGVREPSRTLMYAIQDG